MLVKPRKRICPSLICIAFSNTRRQEPGLRKGRSPSATSINAQALSAMSQKPTSANAYFLAGAAGDVALPPRIALKNSLPVGSTTITSLLLRKLERYASRLR